MSRIAAPALLVRAVCPHCGTEPACSLDSNRVEPPDIRFDSHPPVFAEAPRYVLEHSVTEPGAWRWISHVWEADQVILSRVLALHVEVL